MNTYNFDVNFTTGRIYAPDFILVVNDHNSTLFKFTFDQTGRYVFKLLYPDGTIYVQDIMDNQLKLTKGVLNHGRTSSKSTISIRSGARRAKEDDSS